MAVGNRRKKIGGRAIHRLSAAEALETLQSTAAGLSSEEARRRRRKFGENRLIRAPRQSTIAQLVAPVAHRLHCSVIAGVM